MNLKLILPIIIACAIVAGCNQNAAPNASPAPGTTAPGTMSPGLSPAASPKADTGTTASIVDTEETFEKAMGKNGTWIIATLKDLTFTKDLVLEGEFKNGKKDSAGNDVIQRKIALYTQDDKRNVRLCEN